MAHLEGRRIIQFAGLLADRLDDLRAVVAGVDTPQPGRRVEHLVALGGRIVHAVRRHEHARRLLELAVCGKRHPERVKIVRSYRRIHDHDLPIWRTHKTGYVQCP